MRQSKMIMLALGLTVGLFVGPGIAFSGGKSMDTMEKSADSAMAEPMKDSMAKPMDSTMQEPMKDTMAKPMDSAMQEPMKDSMAKPMPETGKKMQ